MNGINAFSGRLSALAVSAALVLSALSATASEPLESDAPDGEDAGVKWAPFMLGVAPSWPAFSVETDVYGLKLGLPMCGGDVKTRGLEISLFHSGTREIRGVQLSVIGASTSGHIQGVQIIGFGPAISDGLGGLQIAGALGIVGKGTGLQIAPVAIVQDGGMDGTQISLLGVSERVMNGLQVGVVNVSKKIRGVQIGLFNYCDAESGVFQIGLVNVVKDGWLPFMILFNASSGGGKRKSE